MVFNVFSLKNITNGFEDLFQFNNSNILMNYGIIQNCSAQNFTIFTINNSSFYLENTQINDFHSTLMYSSFGFIQIKNSSFTNFNSTHLDNQYIIKFEQNVSFLIKSSLFQNLSNFAYVSFNN